jgi:hypothetical protein
VRAPRLVAAGAPGGERRAVLSSDRRADGFGAVDQPSCPRHRRIHPSFEIVVNGTPLVERYAGSHRDLLELLSPAMDFTSSPSRMAHATSQPSQAQYCMPSAVHSRQKAHPIGALTEEAGRGDRDAGQLGRVAHRHGVNRAGSPPRWRRRGGSICRVANSPGGPCEACLVVCRENCHAGR